MDAAEAEEEEVAGGGVCVRTRAAFGERDPCFLVMVVCVCVVVLCWVCVWRHGLFGWSVGRRRHGLFEHERPLTSFLAALPCPSFPLLQAQPRLYS